MTGRPVLRIWTTLQAQSGTLVDFVPPADVVGLELPDAVDLTGTGTLTLDVRSRLVAELAPLQVLEVVNPDTTVEEWRVLGTDVAGAAEMGVVRVTLVPPIVYDWTAPGRVRSAPLGGLATFDLSGLYTPAQALALALTWLAATGHGHWTAGTIDRTDIKRLTVRDVNPLELLHAIGETWGLEPEPTRVSASSWTIGLRDKVGAAATVPVVRASGAPGALASIRWTRDATTLANAVHAVGADGASIAHAAWPVTDVSGNVISLQDLGGDAGPIQVAGQLVGAYLEKFNGTRTQITASDPNDRVTSLVTVADASTVSGGQILEFRADASGTRLVALEDSAALAAGAYRREVALERSDVDDVRNYVVNPRGATISGGQPVAWSVGTSGGPASTLTRVSTPAGAPIGDDGTGQAWRWSGGYGLGPNASWCRLPVTPALDAASGDATFVGSVWVCATASGSGVVARLMYSGALPVTGTPLAATTLASLPLNQWVRIDTPPATLAIPQDLCIELVPAAGTNVQVVVLAGQIARGIQYRSWAETPQGCVLWQAANAHLLRYRTPEDAFDATVIDRAALDPAAFGDVPLVKGGDVQFQHPEIGLVDQRARVLSILRDRWNGAPPTLSLTAAPDPALAALLGRAAPTRRRTLVDVLQALSQSAGSGP
jgi:hypothetical protein